MKNYNFLKSIAFCASLVCAGPSYSAESNVDAEKPVFDDLLSPEFGGSERKPFKPKEWLDIEAKIKVQLSPEPKSKTADEVVVKWYVAVKNPEKSGYFLLLTKTITHINVPLNEDIYTSIYMSPASIVRLTGNAKGGKNAVEYVGYEVLVDGQVKISKTDKGPDNWWTKSSEKISTSVSVPLLSKNETPFANMWWDRYAEVKPEK